MSSKENAKTYSDQEIIDLRGRLQVLKNEKSLSWASLSQLTGIAEGTISQWVTGSYEGNLSNVAVKVEKFFTTQTARETLQGADARAVPGFLPTKVAARIDTVLIWAHMGNITTVTGAPGVGKTFALHDYVRRNANAWMVTGRPSAKSVVAMLGELVTALKLPTRTSGVGPNHLAVQIIDFLTMRHGLIVFDEAQELGPDALKELRAIHDATGCGIVFTGNEDVLSAGMAKGKNAQLWSRNGSRLFVEKPFAEDVEQLLDAWKVEDKRPRDFLTAIAMRPGGGALRSMTKTLQMASMAASGANEERSFGHIQSAAIHLGYRAAEGRQA